MSYPPNVAAAQVIPSHKQEVLAQYNERFAAFYMPQTRLGASAAAGIEAAASNATKELFGSRKDQFETAIMGITNGRAVLGNLQSDKKGLENAVNKVIPDEINRELFYSELYDKLNTIMGGRRKKSRKSRKSKKTRRTRRSRKN
jgi:hypothetical protein